MPNENTPVASDDVMVRAEGLVKIYKTKETEVLALQGLDLEVKRGELTAMIGNSGSGKSTLLNVLGGLDSFDSGEIYIKGESTANFKQSEYDSYRNTYVGFIFQEYNILDEFSVGANIALAIELQGRKATNEEINEILEQVDLTDMGERKPNELSGGQKQRVAIARALVKKPEIIMADEPTGALDSKTGEQIFDTLKKLSKDKLVLIVSHDREYSERYADRIIELADGVIISDMEKVTNQNESKDTSEDNIELVDNSLKIKKGYQLTNEDLELINQYLKNHELQIESVNKKDYEFINTNEDNIELNQDGFKLIKSSLSLKNSFKIGKSSLKYKRFKLIMTIFLAFVAFTLFGLADTAAAFNLNKTTVNSLKDSKIDYVSLVSESKYYYADSKKDFYYMSHKMNDEQISSLQGSFDIPLKGVFNSSVYDLFFYDYLGDNYGNDMTLRSKVDYIYPKKFAGAAEINEDDVEIMNYTVYGNLPKAANEIAITKYIYDLFVICGYMKDSVVTPVKDYNDLIGKTINLYGQDVTITGIVDTNFDYSRFLKIIELYNSAEMKDIIVAYALSDELNSIQLYSYHNVVFYGDGVLKELHESNGRLFYSCHEDGYVGINMILTEEDHDGWYYLSEYFTSFKYFDELSSVKWVNEPCDNLGQGEVIISSRQMKQIVQSKDWSRDLDDYSIDDFISEYIDYEFDLYLNDVKKDCKIVGIYESDDDLIVLSSDDYKEASTQPDGAIYEFAVGPMPASRNDILKIVKQSNSDKDTRYHLENAVCNELDYIDELLDELSTIFLWIGVFFAVFAALLLSNFISNSISYKKQEIGILRAIGSRSIDVFKIFFAESFIISLINLALSLTGTLTVTLIINHTLRSRFSFLITILRFGPRQVIVLLIISLAVAAIATFLPVNHIAKKKPIDAIRNR